MGVMISKPVRRVAAVIAIIVLLAALALLGLRVLGSRDLLTPPTTDFPTASTEPNPRPLGSHRVMPLVVDGLRVHAEKRRVWAEGPVGERQETNPYWAFRRWPAQLVGVARAGADRTALIISQWSDGELVAIDLHRGRVAWRADAPVGQDTYDGRRTGADTVHDPPALLVATAADGRAAVVVSAPGAVHAYDARTGAALWATDVAAGCRPGVWSSAGLLAVPPCGNGRTLEFVDPVTGRAVSSWSAPAAPAPAACASGHTDCAFVVAGTEVRQPNPDGTLRTVPAGVAAAVVGAGAPGARLAG
ncbi:PQQ-binding-like beta-propeller repeat protein, partial [Luedemannella flava]|uniref:outer membrane protein assembly factor BamB family protein n=1 Tax=Luedemannella flava TaxID=349316 RepID=UPI0031D678FC